MLTVLVRGWVTRRRIDCGLQYIPFIRECTPGESFCLFGGQHSLHELFLIYLPLQVSTHVGILEKRGGVEIAVVEGIHSVQIWEAVEEGEG